MAPIIVDYPDFKFYPLISGHTGSSGAEQKETLLVKGPDHNSKNICKMELCTPDFKEILSATPPDPPPGVHRPPGPPGVGPSQVVSVIHKSSRASRGRTKPSG